MLDSTTIENFAQTFKLNRLFYVGGHFLKKVLPETPLSVIYLVVLAKIAQVIAIDRMRIDSRLIKGGDGIFPNLYSLIFMPSGSGKDRLNNLLDLTVMQSIKVDFKERFEIARKRYHDQVKYQAQMRFPDSPTEQAIFTRAHELHKSTLEITGGTPQAVLSFRETLSHLEFGGLFFRNAEFADYFSSKDANNRQFLNTIKEGYEGDTGFYILKSEKSGGEVLGVPINVLAYSSPDGLNDEAIMRDILTFLSRGYSRRSFICIEKESLEQDESQSGKELLFEAEDEQQKILGLGGVAKTYFDELYEMQKITRVMKATEKADILLLKYRKQLKKQANNTEYLDHQRAEILGRYWRALKLSGVISMFEKHKKRRILFRHAKAAVWFTEYLATYYQKFINTLQLNDNDEGIQKAVEFFIKNDGETISLTTLREQRFVHSNKFKKWFDDCYILIAQNLENRGYILEEEKNGAIGKKYIVKKMSVSRFEKEMQTMNKIQNLFKTLI